MADEKRLEEMDYDKLRFNVKCREEWIREVYVFVTLVIQDCDVMAHNTNSATVIGFHGFDIFLRTGDENTIEIKYRKSSSPEFLSIHWKSAFFSTDNCKVEFHGEKDWHKERIRLLSEIMLNVERKITQYLRNKKRAEKKKAHDNSIPAKKAILLEKAQRLGL